MKINKAELQEALEKVRPGLASKELIEQTTSFAFTGGRVVTYNDEISISHPVKGLDVVGTVKAQALYRFLEKIKKEEIDIEWEENQVIIKAGKSKAGLIFEQEVKLPIKEEIGKIEKWKNLPGNFVEALKLCYPCCSRDMSRPILTCVNIDGEGVQASDSYQIIHYTLTEKIPVGKCLIPATSVKELVKYPVKKVAVGESWIHFRTEDGTVFSSRILNNEFPDTSKHLAIKGVEFSFPKNINQILERAHVFSKKDASPGDIPTVTIEIKEGQIKISAKNEYGWFVEEARTKYSGKAVKFSIGIEFLIGFFDKLQNCIIGDDKIGFSGENWQHMIAMLVEEGKEE
jgi:DNA polymerase III sliding clamp (beta) subunit (PCNA family)